MIKLNPNFPRLQDHTVRQAFQPLTYRGSWCLDKQHRQLLSGTLERFEPLRQLGAALALVMRSFAGCQTLDVSHELVPFSQPAAADLTTDTGSQNLIGTATPHAEDVLDRWSVHP